MASAVICLRRYCSQSMHAPAVNCVRPVASDTYKKIYDLVAVIPPGRVATYGQIAGFLRRGGARQVGYALAATPKDIEIPWHRVINARGEISERSVDGESAGLQKRLLVAEGVLFDHRGRVDFKQCGWEGPDWQWLEKNGYKVYPD